MRQNSSFMVIFSIILLIMMACNITGPSGSTPAGDEPVSVELPVEDTPAVEAAAPAAGEVKITELDPCRMVSKESAEIALGLPVDEPFTSEEETFRLCMYSAVPGEKMVSVTVFEGENAKNYLLNSSTQLLNGCQMSVTATTRKQTPTPFPPEVEALKVESILDLYLRDLEAWKGCGFSYTQLADLGKNVYTTQGLVAGAGIGVATEDAYISFLFGHTEMTPEQALEAAKGLVKRAAQ